MRSSCSRPLNGSRPTACSFWETCSTTAPGNDLPRDYAPKKGLIPLLNSLAPRLLCVRGNCDAEVDQMVLNFPVLADYAVLPVGQRLVYVTHGHVFNLNHLPPLAPGEYFAPRSHPMCPHGQTSGRGAFT
mgnify:CR=1 FL=1